MMNHDAIARCIGHDAGQESRLTRLLVSAVLVEQIDLFEAQAIARCVKYSDQITDVSLGNMFREDIANITRDA